MHKKLLLFILLSTPCLSALLLALFYVTPKHISGLSGVMPMVHLVPIYIWSLLHARHMPLWFAALLGLIVDVATGLPMGLSGLLYCGLIIFVRTQRKYIMKEGFLGMWGYFALAVMLLQLATWIILSMLAKQLAPYSSGIIQWVFTVFSYPLLHILLYPLVDKIADKRYRLLHS